MTTLNIGGRRVRVDDSFKSLSPEKQQQTVDEIAQSLGIGAQEQPQDQTGYGSQIFSGLLEGATGALGAPVDLVNNFVVSPLIHGVNAVAGTDFKPSEKPFGGAAGLREGLAISPESGDAGHRFARRVSQSVGGAAVPLASSAKTAGQAIAGIATATGGGFGGAAAQQLFPGNIGAEIAGELIGGLGTGAGIAGAAKRSARRAAERSVPSVEQLKDRARQLYEQAERQGVTASPAHTKALANNFRQLAVDEGLISPTGRVSEAYPRAAEALRVMDDYATGSMTPTQMQTVRDVLSDAVSATKGKERRIASLMLERFDNFTTPLAPPLQEARRLYSQALRGEQLETLRELAGARAGQYTGSGYENALRTEYRNLDRRITKGQERGWSPEQIEAIQRVARGTPVSNTMRNIGRMAPTGPVSFMGSVGIPGLLGNAVGGPVVGASLATGAALGGYGARGAATAMGIRNADLAELLARGGAANPAANEALHRSLLEALLGSQVATQAQ